MGNQLCCLVYFVLFLFFRWFNLARRLYFLSVSEWVIQLFCAYARSRFAWFHANISSPEEYALLARFGNPSENVCEYVFLAVLALFFALWYYKTNATQPIEMDAEYVHLMISKNFANDFASITNEKTKPTTRTTNNSKTESHPMYTF